MVEMHFEIVKFVISATKRKLPIMLNSAFAQKSVLGLASLYFTEEKSGFRIFKIITNVVLVSALKVLCNFVRILEHFWYVK